VKRCRYLFVRISSGFRGVPRNKTQLWWQESGVTAGKEKAGFRKLSLLFQIVILVQAETMPGLFIKVYDQLKIIV